MTYEAFSEAEARRLVDEHRALEGPLLLVLHAMQARFGFVGEGAIRVIAAELNLSRAEVHGVVSFYHDFREVPAGRRIVKLCRAEACQAAGSTEVAEVLQEALGIAVGETSADRQVSLEAVYCLGLCAAAPAAMIDGRPVARLNAERARRIAEEARL